MMDDNFRLTQKPVVSSDDSGNFPDDLETGFWDRTKDKSALAPLALLVWQYQVYSDNCFPFAQEFGTLTKATDQR